MSKQLVSVIMPSYNQAPYLTEAIQSLQSQSYQYWECFVIDDGSTDETELITLQLSSNDKRIKYTKQRNGGPANARNNGIALAKGDYVLPLDADDKLHPNYLEECVSVLNKDCSIKLVYAKSWKFGAVNEEWLHLEYSYRGILLNNMIYCSAMFRRADFLKTSGYDEMMRKGFEDWEFWLRFLNPEDKVCRIDKIMFYYRVKEKSRTTSISHSIEQEIDSYIYYKHREKYQAFFGHPLTILRESLQLKRMYQNSTSYKIGSNLVYPFQLAKRKLSRILKSSNR